jgi:hypothetical protein
MKNGILQLMRERITSKLKNTRAEHRFLALRLWKFEAGPKVSIRLCQRG